MTTVPYSKLLTLLAIVALANGQGLFLFNGQLITLDDSQGFGTGLRNLYAERQSPLPVQSLSELRTLLQAHPQFQVETGQYISIRPKLSRRQLSSDLIEPQPRPRPQYVFVPSTDELVRSLSIESSPPPPAQFENFVQSHELNRRLWTIRVPPRQTRWYLVLVPPKQYLTADSLGQSPIDQQESQSQNVTLDCLIQSLQALLQSQLEYQSLNLAQNSLALSQQAPLQPESQNITLDSLYQTLQALLQSLSQSESQNIAVDSSAQSREALSQSQIQSESQNKTAQSREALSQSQSQSQNENAQSREALSQSQIQSESQNKTAQSREVLSQSQSQSQNETAQSREALSQSKSQSQSQNYSVYSAKSLNITSQSLLESQSQNNTVDNSEQSREALSQSQSQSQNENAQSREALSQSKSQSQSQNNSVYSAKLLNITSQSLLEAQSKNNTVQLQLESQSQNKTVDNSTQTREALSESQNKTVDNSTQTRETLSQSQNKTVDSSAESREALSQSQLQSQSQNKTLYITSQSPDINSQSQRQPQSQNKTEDSLAQSRDTKSQSQIQSQSQTLAVNSSAQSHAVQSQSQTQSQNLALNISVHLHQSKPETQSQSQLLAGRTGQYVAPLVIINPPKDLESPPIQHIHYLPDRPPQFFTVADIEDDANLKTLELIEKYGYPSETHYANTEDGYELCLHRIPRPGAQPILLVHGLLASSASWVQFGPSNGLAYILYRKGYDVWMLNTRGNLYSREHKIKDLKPRRYWDFSFHEIGKYDLPPAIDMILGLTEQPKVYYIGHSQGSTVFFVMCSERPEYTSKISLMQALAPTVYLQENRSPVLKFLGMFKGKFSMLLNLLGGYEISAKTKLIKQFREHICSTSELASRICAIFDFVLCGFDWKSFNKTLTPIVAAHASQGASAKQIYHYAQLQGDLNFQHFDHGRLLNRIRYNSHTPPQYNLSQAHSKVVLHHGGGDWLGSDSDVGRLQKNLPNLVETRKVKFDSFAHYDFTISKDVRSLVYDSVLGHLASLSRAADNRASD